MNSRADGFNVHGAVRGLTLRDSHLANSGDDCVGVWSGGVENMTIHNVTLANCAVTAGAQSNWGSCLGTYAFASLAINGLRCLDPFDNTTGCNDRTHYSAIHINKARREGSSVRFFALATGCEGCLVATRRYPSRGAARNTLIPNAVRFTRTSAKAFDADCMPRGATLALAGVECDSPRPRDASLGVVWPLPRSAVWKAVVNTVI